MIPKYIRLQNGILECDHLDLAVSRQNVREDAGRENMMALIFECLTQEVTIYFHDLYTGRREEYEAFWPEISAFVKYGVMQDKTFSSVMGKKIIFQDLYGKYHTLKEYLGQDTRLYYASDKIEQARYIHIFKQCGMNALLFDHVLDQPLLMRYEVLFPTVQFARIDSEIESVFPEHVDPEDERARLLAGRFRSVLGSRLDYITLKYVTSHVTDISCLLINDEESRRMTDMMEIYGLIDADDYAQREKAVKRSLIINLSNPLIQTILRAQEPAALQPLISQLFDLAMMSQQALSPEYLNDFLVRSEQLLSRAFG